jgi:tetratricopeptide (TPR) repeat protein
VQNWDEGLRLYNMAVKIDSNFAPVFHARGDLLFKAGRYKAAIADYRKYLSMNDSRTARENYAKVLFLTKDYKTAVSEIKDVQRKDSSSIILFRILGYSYYEMNDFGQGVLNMEKFFSKQKVKDKPLLVADDFAYYGKLLGKTGKDSIGIEQVKKAMKLDSNYVDGYNDIASIYFKTKKYADAAKYYNLKIQKSKKLNPGDYGSLGQSYYRNKDYQKADSAFLKMTDAYPVYGNAWRGRCNAAMENPEKPEKAKPFFELVIQKGGADIERNKKDLEDAYSYLSAYYYLTAKNYDCTKAALLKLQELNPASEKVKSLTEDKLIKAANAENCKLLVFAAEQGK